MQKLESNSKFKKNVLLKNHTTFKIGGPAEYFRVAKTKEDVIKAVKWAKGKKLPFFILAGGSNVLALDGGYKGLVIKIENCKLKIENCNIWAEAGAKLEDLVRFSAEASLTGLEWAAGIPGKVGGAVYGNAQAFNKKMSGIVESVEVLDSKDLKIRNLPKEKCQFSEKNSIFKKNKNLIILSVVLKLKKGIRKEIQKRIKKHLERRRKNHPLDFPSAGSVFINKPDKPPSAYLIEKAGLKGTRVGGAEVSQKHAGFIVNSGGAKAEDVLKLIKIIKKKVKQEFGINLKEEIQIINN